MCVEWHKSCMWMTKEMARFMHVNNGETARFLYVIDEICLAGNVAFHAPVE